MHADRIHYAASNDEEHQRCCAGPQQNSVLWNAMIHPLLNLTITGAIWYQGIRNYNQRCGAFLLFVGTLFFTTRHNVLLPTAYVVRMKVIFLVVCPSVPGGGGGGV